MPRIAAVKVLEGYVLDLTFDDGVSGQVDLSDLVGKGVFAAWCDRRVFAQVRIGSCGELIWGEEIDLCPDALYMEVTGLRPEDVFPALRHERALA